MVSSRIFIRKAVERCNNRELYIISEQIENGGAVATAFLASLGCTFFIWCAAILGTYAQEVNAFSGIK